MKTVTVAASRRYDVLIGPGLLREAGAFAAEAVRPCRAAIVSDDTVDALYGAAAEEASGGSQAVFFKINTWGEEAFLDTLRQVLDSM